MLAGAIPERPARSMEPVTEASSTAAGLPRLVGTSSPGTSADKPGLTRSDSEDSSKDSSDEATLNTPLFKSAQWSADGTTILTSREDNTTECFILPPDLLDGSAPHVLSPYATHQFPSPVYATAVYPNYQLGEPSSAIYIASVASLPTRLLSPFAPGILSSYPLINKTTEAYIAPHSLLFGTGPRNTDHFFAGSSCQISVFNILRDGEGPLEEMPTIPSRRKKIVGGGVGMKGIVSALAMNSDGVLAAGTFTRWIGLYDGDGRGGTVGVFELGRDPNDSPGVGDGGGITQLHWSTCGRYLCTAERGSDGIGVWDIRGTGKRLAWLRGRKAPTMQRLGFDVVGDNVWAGGVDGTVRLWGQLGKAEGVIDPDWEFKAHDDAVSSSILHPSTTVLATCSGQRPTEDTEDFDDTSTSSDEESDNRSEGGSNGDRTDISSTSSKQDSDPGGDRSLKIWAW